MSKKQAAQKSAFKDVTDAEPDEIAAEQAVRASAQFNGGGPWPRELLLEKFVNRGAAG